MTSPEARNARAELDSARNAVGRLDASRGSEDLAADLIDVWNSVEAALRTLVGSSVLSGQPLIREARQRQLIDFEAANALAEFEAVHHRLQDTKYRPTEGDANAARTAFLKLDTALLAERVSGARQPAASGELKTMPAAAEPTPVAVIKPPARFRVWHLAVLILVVIGLGIGAVTMFSGGGGSSKSLEQGVAAYRAGRREEAVSAFSKAVREDPKNVLAHVYLARMAREVGNFTLSGQELQTAIESDPKNATALREMGSNMLAQNNYEVARKFYVRAVEADTTDKMAMGYLGCTLMRLNRVQEATAFLNRAGPGPWSNCTPGAPVTPGQVPGVIPR